MSVYRFAEACPEALPFSTVLSSESETLTGAYLSQLSAERTATLPSGHLLPNMLSSGDPSGIGLPPTEAVAVLK
jgi:hypothetical protein